MLIFIKFIVLFKLILHLLYSTAVSIILSICYNTSLVFLFFGFH